ncbi:hypothetical protein [Novosphingobium fuchskuhlense]|uniref:hypothetical protein n=1 Tax=Novosphingobium fuchskuhlense TaxID=1117702 RepID=UPI0012E3622B|nr:hypothetical protein [Novosphingobium fuchskuhlense]
MITTHAYTMSHTFQPARRIARIDQRPARARRTSPVLTPQELRQAVEQMVD